MENNFTEEWQEFLIEKRLPYTVYLFLCLIIGILGNGFVFFIYQVKMKGDSEHRYFIPHLALMDFFACFTASVLCLISNFNPVIFPSESLCKFLWYSSWSSSAVSTLILLLIAIQRYLAVCKPHGPQMSGKWSHIVYGTTVVVCLLLAIPFVYLTGNIPATQIFMNENMTAYYCSTGAGDETLLQFESGYFTFLFLVGTMNIILTMCFYIPIGITIYKTFNKQSKNGQIQNEESTEFESSCDTSSGLALRKSSLSSARSHSVYTAQTIKKRVKTRNRFTVMLMFIVLVYILSNIPTLAVLVIWKDDPEFWTVTDKTQLNALFILRRLFIVNNIVNPFLYGYFDLKFRNKFIEVVKCHFKDSRCCRL